MNDAAPFTFRTIAAYVGGPSPYSPNFESLVTTSLEGIQSTSIALDYQRQSQFAWDGGGDQVMIERPTAQLGFSYVFASGTNERRLGFVVAPSNTVSALSDLNTERNYYVAYSQGGQDLIGYSGKDYPVMAFGNGVMSRYEFSANVGQPSLVNVTIEALNLLFQASGTGQILPAVYKQSGIGVTGQYVLPVARQTTRDYFEAKPSAIALTFNSGCAVGAAMSGANSCPVQSFTFSVDIPRESVKDIGWAYPNVRAARWPVDINIRATAYLNAVQTDALNRFGCPDSGMSFGVRFNNSCTEDYDAFTYQFTDAKLTSQRIESRVGSFTQLSMDWSVKVYDVNRTGPNDPNFYITSSGTAYSSLIFPQVDYVTGAAPLVIQLGTLCYLLVLSGPAVLDGNQVQVSDEPATSVVRVVATDGSETQDITLAVT